MPAYWLSRVKVTDPIRFREYGKLAPGIISAHGGKFIGAGDTQVLEGSPSHDIFMVIEFPSMAAAQACYNSDDYQHAASLREGAGELEIVVVDAGSVESLRPI